MGACVTDTTAASVWMGKGGRLDTAFSTGEGGRYGLLVITEGWVYAGKGGRVGCCLPTVGRWVGAFKFGFKGGWAGRSYCKGGKVGCWPPTGE